ncbi:hypothetical protein [Schaalia odontolytica]|uniref:hypothetical protein n=1 Tax=Schaalia odontolytica TaxID=1660 RepID=UPI001D06B580|nr:hypothetical protein [Schaalia odontolytica]MCB6401535.1 hypothetical protein [Schaalia odontolytica]
MSDERSQVLDRIEDAIGALVNQRHGPGRLIGAWEIMIETIDPSRPDLTAWMTDGRGSMLARRGLIKVSRDQYRGDIEDVD